MEGTNESGVGWKSGGLRAALETASRHLYGQRTGRPIPSSPTVRPSPLSAFRYGLAPPARCSRTVPWGQASSLLWFASELLRSSRECPKLRLRYFLGAYLSNAS